MTAQEIIKKIKSRGYWKVHFKPEVFNEHLIEDRGKIKEIIEKSVVRLRGWDYPHFSHWDNPKSRRAIYGNDYIEGGSDWGTQIEFWRMYQSGQFIHLFAMDEDWFNNDDWYSGSPSLQAIQPGEVLGVVSVIYTVTEIFEFFHQLAKNNVYTGKTHISIAFGNTHGRILKILDGAGRAPLFFKYKSSQEYIEYQKDFLVDKLLTDYKKAAIDAVCWLFESFGWENIPREVFEKDQQNFYERRF